MAKYTWEQQKLSQVLSKVIGKQSTLPIYTTYQGKQNSSVLLTNK